MISDGKDGVSLNKIRLGVLFGGVSSEHDVSLLSVASILSNLDPQKYEVIRIGITRDGRWLLFEGDNSLLAQGDAWAENCPCAMLVPDRSIHGILVLRDDTAEHVYLDAILPVLHGKNGEDGTVQGLCELAGIPYVGCGVMSSAVCMDKEITHCVLSQNGIRTAKWLCLTREEANDLDIVCERIANAELQFPLFVKPANAGSSVGISKAHNREELSDSLRIAFREDYKALLEETLIGSEVECAVMGNEYPVASQCIGEVEPLRELYDYEGKYLDGSTALHIPARVVPEVAERVRDTALRAYRVLGCRGLSRIDFFVLRDSNEVVLNEVNTLPGFTNISMYPKLFCHDGWGYGELLDHLVALALEKR